jgi:signal transduction histidine kinase
MRDEISTDIAAVQSIQAVPKMLNLVCRTTGMRFAAVARVTEDRWVACSVRDDIAFGLQPGGELDIKSTICHEIRQSGKAVVIDHVASDPEFCRHHTPMTYGLQSYISMPIRLTDGTFFGTLCAIDPEPHLLNTPETIEMFEMFADLIGFHLSTIDRMRTTEAHLAEERRNSELREQFIAVLGHDLRNPLTGISGGMQLLKRMKLDEKGARIVDMIHGSAERMAGLIDNVMDFARGRLGGGISLNRDADEPIEPILRQVIQELLVGAHGREIESYFDITVPVNCDRRRVAQLASNLLGNALNYGSPEKPVLFSAVTRQRWFEVFVANTGDPIPGHVLKSIFEPFHRGELSHGREGLGLGLYISHEIAAAHGGRLDVVSTPEETRFTFRMPVGEKPLPNQQ